MATLKQVEEQIFQREGFRVTLTPLDPKTKAYPAYDYRVMASNKWRISDWKSARLAPYTMLVRSVTPLRASGEAVKTDLRLGNLRDAYFEAEYGGGEPDSADGHSSPSK